MRKLFIIAVVLSSSLLTAGCFDDDKTCRPGAVRQDVNYPEKYWVCNKDGSDEAPLTGPVPPGDPKNNWG